MTSDNKRDQINLRLEPKRATRIQKISEMKVYVKYKNSSGKIVVSKLFDDLLQLAIDKPELLVKSGFEKEQNIFDLITDNQDSITKVNELTLSLFKELFKQIENLQIDLKEIKTNLFHSDNSPGETRDQDDKSLFNKKLNTY